MRVLRKIKSILTLLLRTISIVFLAGLFQTYGSNGDRDHEPKEPQRPIPSAQVPLIEDVALYFSKGAVVASATCFLSRRCEEWAADLTVKLIQNHVQSKNSLFDFTIAGAVRGKTIKDALPIAQEKGKMIGIVAGTVAVPFIWDCSILTCRSWTKIIQYALAEQDENTPAPKRRDYCMAGVGTAAIGITALLIYRLTR